MAPAPGPARAPLFAPPPRPEVENVDETAYLARPVLSRPLPFTSGQFAPEGAPIAPREPRADFDPDATLPVREQVDSDPSLPFVKMLPSQGHKKGRS